MRTNRKIAAGLAAAALVGGLAAGCGGSGGGNATLSPEALVKHDGYTVIMALTPTELSKLGGEGLPEYLAPYLAKDAKVAVGMKGDNMELVVQLTDAGAQLVKPQLSTAPISGATAHMDGNNVTFAGPVSSFESGSDTTPPTDTTSAPETPAAPQEHSGPLGTVFTPADSLDMYGTVQVRVDKVTYGVKTSDPYASQPAKGNQLVALQVSAKAEKLTKSGTASVNTTTFTLLGSDGQGYDTMNSAATYAATFKGEFKFAGQHESGTLMTEMPKGVTVTAVKYTGGDEPFTWNVAKLARVPMGAGASAPVFLCEPRVTRIRQAAGTRLPGGPQPKTDTAAVSSLSAAVAGTGLAAGDADTCGLRKKTCSRRSFYCPSQRHVSVT